MTVVSDPSMTLVSDVSDATVLDVRWELGGPPGRPQYLEGHIPGAAFVDLDASLSGPPGDGGRHPMPSADVFGGAMRTAGVSGDRAVVVYDAGNAMAAARCWWLLRYFGHAQVFVLNGGFSGWRAAGRAIERGAVAIEPGDFVPHPGGMPLLDAAGAARVADAGLLLDARAPERFRGEVEPIDPVAGHIPGAVNLPAGSLVDAAGRFLPAGALRERFAAAGVRERVEVGAYCGSGVSAAQEVLALSVAGFSAGLYVGSWSDWIRDPSRPVATGG
jgi:thiosulfate/3-mercaptopyruvate sulfurtransferase